MSRWYIIIVHPLLLDPSAWNSDLFMHRFIQRQPGVLDQRATSISNDLQKLTVSMRDEASTRRLADRLWRVLRHRIASLRVVHKIGRFSSIAVLRPDGSNPPRWQSDPALSSLGDITRIARTGFSRLPGNQARAIAQAAAANPHQVIGTHSLITGVVGARPPVAQLTNLRTLRPVQHRAPNSNSDSSTRSDGRSSVS